MVLISDGAEKRRRKHLFAIVVYCHVMAIDVLINQYLGEIFQNVNHDKGWTHMSLRVYSCPGEHDRTTVFYTVSVR